MPMPSFSVADLKSSANKAKDFGSGKFNSARDRYSSPASKNLSWDASKGPPPPPPPPLSRSSASISHTKSPPPPPTHLSRSSTSFDHGRGQSTPSKVDESASPSMRAVPARPPPIVRPRQESAAAPNHSSLEKPPSGKVDWANLSSEDKQVLFGWLDEYFSQRLGVAMPPRSTHHEQSVVAPAPQRPPPPSASSRASGPPSIPKWSRPAEPSPAPSASPHTDSLTSYPPGTEHGSAALDLAHYFAPSTHWESAWYTTANPLPPPLQGNTGVSFLAAWEMHGAAKTLYAGVLFADLSLCWFSVRFSTAGRAEPDDARAVQRSARYLPRPGALDGRALRGAAETYGETVAGFAESFAGSGEVCARGECWDLASEALGYFAQYDYVPAPVRSIARTHGHLVYEGRAGGGQQAGRWRGGDDRVRRGDIVEWRRARVAQGPGSWSTLGDPDHTAVVVADAEPAVAVADGQSVRPAELGTLVVVEQSAGSPPERAEYPLGGFDTGEIWIYRPVGMLEYVGALLEAKCPDGVNAMSL